MEPKWATRSEVDFEQPERRLGPANERLSSLQHHELSTFRVDLHEINSRQTVIAHISIEARHNASSWCATPCDLSGNGRVAVGHPLGVKDGPFTGCFAHCQIVEGHPPPHLVQCAT